MGPTVTKLRARSPDRAVDAILNSRLICGTGSLSEQASRSNQRVSDWSPLIVRRGVGDPLSPGLWQVGTPGGRKVCGYPPDLAAPAPWAFIGSHWAGRPFRPCWQSVARYQFKLSVSRSAVFDVLLQIAVGWCHLNKQPLFSWRGCRRDPLRKAMVAVGCFHWAGADRGLWAFAGGDPPHPPVLLVPNRLRRRLASSWRFEELTGLGQR